MNKTINQLINQLHLDPKKEAAVRKIVENVGGSNNSTSACAKEVYSIKTSEFKTPEDFNNLEAAVDARKIIIIDGTIIKNANKDSSNGKPIIMAETDLILHTYSGNEHENNIVVLTIIFESNGTYTTTYNQISLKSGYNGTKFLSDDGTYKEVSDDNLPVIIEYPYGSNEEIAVTDEQIEAVKNGNFKIKLTIPGTTNYVILAPISISIMKEAAKIVVISYFEENISDATLVVVFTNKTISIPA